MCVLKGLAPTFVFNLNGLFWCPNNDCTILLHKRAKTLYRLISFQSNRRWRCINRILKAIKHYLQWKFISWDKGKCVLLKKGTSWKQTVYSMKFNLISIFLFMKSIFVKWKTDVIHDDRVNEPLPKGVEGSLIYPDVDLKPN